MKFIYNRLKILFITCFFSIFQPGSIIAQVNQSDGLLSILSNDQNNLIIELTIPHFEKKNKSFQGKKFDVLNIPDFTQTCEPGKPQLPLKGYLFGVPINSTTSFEILEAKFKIISPFDIFYTPKIIYAPDSSSIKFSELTVKLEPEINRKISSINQFYPDKIIKLHDSAFIREQRVGKLSIFPIQYNPVTKEIRYYAKIKIRIHFSANQESNESSIPEKQFPEPYEKLLSKSLLNYELSKSFRRKVAGSSGKLFKPSRQLNLNDGEWYKIIVDEDWTYRIDKSDLLNAGIDVSQVNPKKIKIYFQGQEIPIFIFGEEDGAFDDSDFIEFYGTATKNDYSYDNVYWLTVDTNDGLRMVAINGELNGTHPIVTRSEKKLHFEQNKIYFTSVPDGEGEDHWFWDYIQAPNSLNLSVTLNNVVNISPLPCKLKIEYRGITHTVTNPDHHTIVSINGNTLLNDTWDGQAKFQSEANFTQGFLNEGNNTVRINSPGDTGANVDYVYVNWINIEYWQDYSSKNDVFTFLGRDDPVTHQFEIKNFSNSAVYLYDITDQNNVKRFINFSVDISESNYTLKFQDDVSSRHYFALTSAKVKKPKSIIKKNVSKLLSENNQADYIFVTSEIFFNALATLANFRENQGLHVKTIKVQDIYDEFNFGVKNPQAIKDFLSYAYFNWRKPSPTYVLLVGDASYDYKDYLGTGNLDLLPTHLFESSVYSTETSSDNWFACVSGEDILADILLGRLPVRTTAQLNVITNKIISYETNPEQGNWNRNLIFVSDNADDGGNFEGLSNHLSTSYIPQDFNVSKIYLSDYGGATETKNAIIDQISDGCLLVNYVGHGSLDTWAAEKIFKSDQVVNLTNNRKLPLVVTMSCLNGFFQHANTPYCLSEEFLKANNGGAVACFSPSGFGYTIGDQYLGDGLFKALFQDNDYILGSAVLKAKLSLFSAGNSFKDHISFFNLLC